MGKLEILSSLQVISLNFNNNGAIDEKILIQKPFVRIKN